MSAAGEINDHQSYVHRRHPDWYGAGRQSLHHRGVASASLVNRGKSVKVRKANAGEFCHVGFSGVESVGDVPRQRTDALVGGVDIAVRSQVHGPGRRDCLSKDQLLIHRRLSSRSGLTRSAAVLSETIAPTVEAPVE